MIRKSDKMGILMLPSHVMIELQTMGTVPGCAIVAIGAVLFDPRYNVVETDRVFYTELDYNAQDGLLIDNDSREWWSKRPNSEKLVLNGIDDLDDQLFDFSRWLPFGDYKVWSNTTTFQISILEYCYRYYKMEVPWRYWNIMDGRTLLDMYNYKKGSLNNSITNESSSNALDNAVNKALKINEMYSYVTNGNN